MLWRGFEGFLQRVRSAGIGIGDDEPGLIEAGFLTDAEHRAVTRHDAARQLQMRKALARVRMRRRKDIRKGLADHADDGRHLGDVRNPFRTQPVTGEENQRRQAVEDPGQPPPALVGIDHDETEMGDFRRFAVEFDLHHRQRVEGDRPSGRFLADQRDDGA